MTYQEFRKEYPSFGDLYLYCVTKDLHHKLIDWLNSDYSDKEYSENLYSSIEDFLIHWNVIESPDEE